MKFPNFHFISAKINSVKDKGFFHLLSSNFVIQFLGFGVILFLPSVLTPAEIGNVRLLQSYSVIFILIGTFGYNVSLLKICSEDVSTEEKNLVFKYCIQRTLLFSFLSYVLLIGINYYYIRHINPILGKWLPLYGSIIPFASIVYCLTAYLQSQKKIKDVAVVQVIVRLIFLVLIIISTYYFGFIGFIFSTVISYIVGILPFILFIPLSSVTVIGSTHRKKQINNYAYYTVLGAFVTTIGLYADLYLLDYLNVSDIRLGVYSFSTLFLQAGMIAVNTIQSIVSPYISEQQDDKQWVWKKTVHYQGICVLFSILIAIVLYLGSVFMTTFYLGEQYSELPDFVLGIIGRFLIWSCFAVVGASLVGLGRFKEGFYLALLTTPIGIVLGYTLFPQWGIYGIIIAQMIAALITLTGCWAILWKVVRNK